MDVVVLDGEQRSALAVTRSLGKRGIKVIVGSAKPVSLSSCSRYCSESFSYPSPYGNPSGFIEQVNEYCASGTGKLVYPQTDVSLSEILP